MSVIARRTEQGMRLTGREDELRAHLTALIAAGRLDRDGLAESGRLADGRCYATVRLIPAPPPVRPRCGELSPNVVAGGLVAATVLVGAAWVVFLLGHLELVAVVLVVLLGWAALGRVGVCPGLHCPGCKHR